MSSTSLPETHRALRLLSLDSKPSVEVIATPKPTPGSVVIQVLATPILSYQNQIYPPSNTRKYPYPLPLTGGSSAIGRITAIGPDAASLEEGQFVYFDSFIRARDDHKIAFLSAIHEGFSAASKKLMRDVWRDGSYAEYVRAPLENVFALNEERLCGNPSSGIGLGHTPEDLIAFLPLLVPYGGLRDVHLQPGETVIIAPATGPFGGAAVKVALAMGAKVIAIGRNQHVLKKLAEHERVDYVPMTGDAAEMTAALKKFGPIDVYFDISPPQAADSKHMKVCILALKHSGRVSLMGGLLGDVAIPHAFVMACDITLKGKWMYNRDDILSMIRLVESGILKIGESAGTKVAGKFGLEEWEEAFNTASEKTEVGGVVVFVP
jgi:threonine dehydrogenase-like Zn-dependent dehydrogenase